MNLHPIVAQVAPSEEQVPAVTARGVDVVVTAGAGTGKTRTLVARYLGLVADLPDDVPLRATAAVTFTRKAAREMRNRVREEMRRYLDAALDAAERARWQSRYAELDSARIGTIHSLCSEILRSHPAEGAVDPRFEVLDEGQAGILMAEARSDAMAWAANDARSASLFGLLGARGLDSTLDWLLRRRLDSAAAFERQPQDVLSHWSERVATRCEEALGTFLADSAWQSAVGELRSRAADDTSDPIERMRRDALAAVDGASRGSLADRLDALSRLEGINLTGGGAGAWRGGADEKQAVKDSLKLLRAVWKAHAPRLSMVVGPMDERIAAHLPALRYLFDQAVAAYDDRKSDRQALDYEDLEHRSIDLLRRHPAVLARWQGELRAILVDEFQDTNARQRELLDLLNGHRGRLFVVGDAKQSIYRFRGADVTVFRRARSDVRREGGAVIDLAVSYRAHAPLVRALNALLRPVLGGEADEDRPWVEPFAPLVPARDDPARGLDGPFVEVILAIGSKSGGALDRAAAALADRLAGLVEDGGVTLGTGPSERPLGYDDIAIMCRSSVSFGAYEDALEAAGVPVLTVAGRGFYGRPEVRDLLNALAAIAEPVDDLALVGLLRSPVFQLPDPAIYRICESWRGLPVRASLWQALDEGRIDLAEHRETAERAVTVVRALHDRVGRQSVGDVLKALLDETDYRAALLRAGQRRAARNVGKLLADAYESRIVRLGEFLAYVANLRDVGARQGEARATAEGAVQLMSVHAAKGLEFPVVVIGDATHGHAGRNGVLLDSDLGVVLPLKDDEGDQSAAYRLAKLRSDDQEAAESDRLLYVAATRARELLLVNGCISVKKDGRPGAMGGWLGRLAGPLALSEMGLSGLDPEAGQNVRIDLRCDGEPATCLVCAGECARGARIDSARVAAADGDRPDPAMLAPLAPVPVRMDDAAERDREPPRRAWRVVPVSERPRAPARVVGLVVHEALASWRFPGEGFDGWAASRAAHHGVVDAAARDAAVDRCREILRRFAESELCADIRRAERRLAEVPYARLDEHGLLEVGTIDLLFAGERGWTLVDYKTDRFETDAELLNPPVVARLESYRRQVARYAAAVRDLSGERPRALLCLLDAAGAVRTEDIPAAAPGPAQPAVSS